MNERNMISPKKNSRAERVVLLWAAARWPELPVPEPQESIIK